MEMSFSQAKEVLKSAGIRVCSTSESISDESLEDKFVRDTITKMVNDFPYKNRNKALVNDPKKRSAIEEFIRNYYNSMPDINDCVERLYAAIEQRSGINWGI